MFASRTRSVAASVSAVIVSLSLAVPTVASATAGPLATAPSSAYNATPDCPVSPTDPVCSWNVSADSSNAFGAGDYGECPYWAAEKYPTLVTDEASGDPDGEDWNGNTWAEHAQAEGLTVSSVPASGDLAVWQATDGDISGHVAYVEAIDGDAIIVSQMDGESSAPFPAMQGSTEYISAANLAYYEQSYGLEFVSTGDPSTTPLSYVEQPTATAASVSPPTTAATPKPAAVKKPAKKHHKRRRAHRKHAARSAA